MNTTGAALQFQLKMGLTLRQFPASMTSVVEAPRVVSSDASPTRPLWAVKRASIPGPRRRRR